MKRLLFGFALTVVLCGLAAERASADVIVYTNRAAFEAALGSPVNVETFNDAILNPGLSFTSNTGSASINTGRFNDRLTPGTNTTWSFVPPTFGFGGEFDLSPGGAGLGIQITTIAPGGATTVISQQIPENYTGQFWGFVSTDAIQSVRLTTGTQGGVAETYNMDNLTYGGTAVPEPATMTLLGLGAFGMMGYGWRKRRQAVAA